MRTAGPPALLVGGVIGTAVTLALLVMHAVPAVVLLTTLRLLDNRTSAPTR
jgi:hypothetical protein